MSQSQESVEKTGPHFNWDEFKAVQKQTIEALHVIAREIQPGMLESEAYELSKSTLTELGFGKSWHRPYVRFGANTTLMFGQPSPAGTRLQETDLFYLDIGPVKNGYEGDAGDTFLVGHNPEMEKCIADTRSVFFEAQEQWRRHRTTGQELYRYADQLASQKGWILNLKWHGHRVSDFPHQVYFKGNIAELEFTPSAGLWVLEIHLCDPQGRFGAFYEDLLSE